MSKNRFLKIVLSVLIVSAVLAGASPYFYQYDFLNNTGDFIASIFFVDSITVESLKYDYQAIKNKDNKIKILIVPGHDNEYFGTQFNGLKEADLTLELAGYLADFLKQDKNFDIILSRDKNGYNPDIASYFDSNQANINEFIESQKKLTDYYINLGLIKKYDKQASRSRAPDDMAFRLFGINKWVNENKVKIAIHIHFNNYGRKKAYSAVGRYTGFSIIIPEKQFSNAKASAALATLLNERLQEYFSPSDAPGDLKNDEDGVIEDQLLIAIGSYNSLDAASALIEYGYIYESQFTNPKVRPLALKLMAFQTYAGIEDFFSGESKIKDKAIGFAGGNSRKLLKNGTKNDPEVFNLQAKLTEQGFYPPSGFSKNDCPLSGNFFQCTELAVKKFQENYNLPSTGVVGDLTRAELIE